ncbi:MAG: hypothetical protein GXY44_06950 [Phycisphaerales bacterium]|nr:hypothetical protein [Phycisphaerales bacterium]
MRQDTVWQGEMEIREPVSVMGVTVRVAPGTTIRFKGQQGAASPPAVFLNSTAGNEPRLMLEGTADRPIIVETPEDLPPGMICTTRGSHGTLIAQHVVFRRLGGSTSGNADALDLQLSAVGNELRLIDCRFENCGPVRMDFLGPTAAAEIKRCDFADTQGDTALLLGGSGSGEKTVTDNIADAGFRLDCPDLLLRDNVLVGPAAAISVPTLTKEGIRLDRNYVHCTYKRDEGRYALKCDTPHAELTRNVLIGGTYVVAAAPRTVRDNVLIGVAGLEAKVVMQEIKIAVPKLEATTHALITGLANEASIQNNLLLGPTHAALSISGPDKAPRIEHNLFDGWDAARRAVHFNLLARGAVGAELKNNVFTRYQRAPVFDQAGLQGTMAEASDNLFAGFTGPIYENIKGVDDLASSDRRIETFGQLRLAAPLTTQAALDAEERLLRREIGVADVHALWLAAYRPMDNSPLRGKKASIGPSTGDSQ